MIAQNLEAQIIRVPTGCQDYYPAMYGGVSAVELGPAGIKRVGLDVPPDELNARFVLAYTGVPRNSGINNWEVTKAHIDGDKQVHKNFDRIAAIAHCYAAGPREAGLERGRPPAAGGVVESQEERTRNHHPSHRFAH